MNRPSGSSLPSISSSLLLKIQQMQPDAWRRLVETFSPIVYGWCRKAGVSEHDSADIVQEVFSSVARGIGSFEREKTNDSFRCWLATITRNRITDAFRRGQKQPDAHGGTAFLEQVRNVAEQLENSVSETHLNQALPRRLMSLVQNEVEPRTWQAFWLTTVEDRNAEDVANELQMNVASVYQAKSRVLRRIRARMAELP